MQHFPKVKLPGNSPQAGLSLNLQYETDISLHVVTLYIDKSYQCEWPGQHLGVSMQQIDNNKAMMMNMKDT